MIDTWSNYNRRHAWVAQGRVQEDLGPGNEKYYRLNILCVRCHETRKVFNGVMWESPLPVGLKWGCARVPLLYRLKLWLQGREIPHWDVNTRPPWVSP